MYHNPDDDNAPGSPPPTEPAPDELRCANCAGPHPTQRCPEILAALFAPMTGAEIARAWHRNYRGWARRIGQQPASERIRAAYLYTRYMGERLPKQRYQLRLTNTLAAWEKAAA